MNLNETIKVNSDLTFLRGQVMMILEQQLFLAKKQAEYEKLSRNEAYEQLERNRQEKYQYFLGTKFDRYI